MKFTATEKFNTYAVGAGKDIVWNCYYRATASLNGSVTDSNWTNVTDYVEDFSEPKTKIEYQAGSFSADSVSITGIDIEYWRTNVFNVTNKALNIEFKLTAQVNDAEIVIPFSGIADTSTIDYKEETDSLSFKINTAEILAGTIKGYVLNTQYINSDGRLILNNIPGVYIDNANIGGYPLKTGRHKIKFEYKAGDETGSLYLDESRAFSTPTTSGTVTLGDCKTEDFIFQITDTEKLDVYVNVDELPKYDITLTDTVIVETQGNTLPQCPYYGKTLSEFIKLVYNRIGIDTVNINLVNLTTNNIQWSPIDTPVNDGVVVPKPTAICAVGNYILMGIGSKLYSTDTTGTYTSLHDMGTGSVITKLMYNNRNSHIWIYYRTSAGRQYIKVASTNGTTYTDIYTWQIGEAIGVTFEDGVTILDYNYSGSDWKYGLLYQVRNPNLTGYNGVRFLQASDGTDILVTDTDATILFNSNVFVAFIEEDGDVIFPAIKRTDMKQHLIKVAVTSSFGAYSIIADEYTPTGKQIYNHSNRRIYFIDNYIIKCAEYDSNSTNILETQVLNDTYKILSMYEDTSDTTYNGSIIYVSTATSSDPTAAKYSVTFAIKLNSVYNVIKSPRIDDNCITSLNSHIYISDYLGNFGEFTNSVIPYIAPEFDYTDITLRELLNQLLKAYNLTGIINSYKVASVYRRMNMNTTPKVLINSGQEVELTSNEVCSISINENEYQGYDIIEFNKVKCGLVNNTLTFGIGSFSDARILTLDSAIVPSVLNKDVCGMLCYFFSVDRKLYTVECGNIPYFQYEPFDKCILSMSDIKTNVSVSGTIYSATYMKDGSTKFDVLI